jgi:hypothetical protein
MSDSHNLGLPLIDDTESVSFGASPMIYTHFLNKGGHGVRSPVDRAVGRFIQSI